MRHQAADLWPAGLCPAAGSASLQAVCEDRALPGTPFPSSMCPRCLWGCLGAFFSFAFLWSLLLLLLLLLTQDAQKMWQASGSPHADRQEPSGTAALTHSRVDRGSLFRGDSPEPHCRPGQLLLILVASAPGNTEPRQAIRRTWAARARPPPPYPWQVVFLVGRSLSKMTTGQVQQEQQAFGDILLGGYLDTYRNLTLKVLHGLKWSAERCQPSFILKTDDDCFVNTDRLPEFLVKRSPLERGLLYAGSVFPPEKRRVIRHPASKWYVSREDYPASEYPPYASGIGYLLSLRAASLKHVFSEAHTSAIHPSVQAFLASVQQAPSWPGMAEGVTYADLRFVRSPPEKTLKEGTEGEGEIAYENVEGPRSLEGEETLKESKGSKPWVKRTIVLGLLAACLFLLATAVGLGARYGQVSGQLQRASQDHTDHTSILAQWVRVQDQSLAEMEVQLHKAKMELNSTQVALWKSLVATERTQKHLEKVEDQLRDAKRSLDALKWETERMEAELRQATSCQKVGCCPQGWTLFRWKCLWVSEEAKSWMESKASCEWRASHLLILKEPWGAREIWETVVGEMKAAEEAESSLQSKEYWIGLNETHTTGRDNWVFTWVDGSRYEGSEVHLVSTYFQYGILINGVLAVADKYYAKRRYVCEKAAAANGSLFLH